MFGHFKAEMKEVIETFYHSVPLKRLEVFKNFAKFVKKEDFDYYEEL